MPVAGASLRRGSASASDGKSTSSTGAHSMNRSSDSASGSGRSPRVPTSVEPPASIVLLGGDVHHAYVAEVTLGDRPRRSRVFQIVCSPFRNPLTRRERLSLRVTGSRAAAVLFAFLARLAGVPPTADQWEFVREPTFHNSIGELELDRRSARITIRRSAREGELADGLYLLHETMLANHQTTHASTLNPKGELDASHA